MATAGLIALL
jgi:hypothetical protein